MQAIAPGIRAMSVISDYPEWWACIKFDGFKSYVNMNEGLQQFAFNNIRYIKKGAGTSHMNQPMIKHKIW